ncbi:carbon-nitrogen family hydrolase [Oceanobacillus bengalensis]|uniref:Carbon-nitrogen family hydrolase n=1 Tax=Oceanobacillus bengalensis TaxID=1435466 RepID=A0A494YZY0_9BACI|nr:carbon-nitrogen family hydrolase [Oceanobacillus bengalensis]RKQ15814.1 carbon-nitrogen family hydrolase [Oceanobacillus bengalensis]
MKHAIYQMDIVPGKPEVNRERVEAWIRETVRNEQPDVLVLPEMWTTAYTLKELEQIADVKGEPTTSFLQKLAAMHKVNIIGGSFANKKAGNFYNSSVVIDKKGSVVHRYDKIHLVPMLDEPKYLAGGTEKAKVFELDGVKMGLIICYDLRFPELTRSLALQGAEILYIVAEWPTVRKEHWKALQIARAIENQFFVVSCNRIGHYGGEDFAGTSMVIDPWGEKQKVGSETKEETIITTLPLDIVTKIRKDVPIFVSRVPELY